MLSSCTALMKLLPRSNLNWMTCNCPLNAVNLRNALINEELGNCLWDKASKHQRPSLLIYSSSSCSSLCDDLRSEDIDTNIRYGWGRRSISSGKSAIFCYPKLPRNLRQVTQDLISDRTRFLAPMTQNPPVRIAPSVSIRPRCNNSWWNLWRTTWWRRGSRA